MKSRTTISLKDGELAVTMHDAKAQFVRRLYDRDAGGEDLGVSFTLRSPAGDRVHVYLTTIDAIKLRDALAKETTLHPVENAG